MSRECFSPETEGRADSRHSAPFARMIFRFASVEQPMIRESIMLWVELPRLLKRQQAESSVGVPTMVLSETLAPGPGLTAFLGYPRRHRVARETEFKPNPPKDTHPRTLSVSPAWQSQAF